MLTTDTQRGMAKTYLGYARDGLHVAAFVEPDRRAFWFNEAIADMRKAAAILGFDLVPRPAEKLEAAE